jgi:hypothetical protein
MLGSDIFEDNDLYITGRKYKNSINQILLDFDEIYHSVFPISNNKIIEKDRNKNEKINEIKDENNNYNNKIEIDIDLDIDIR